MKSCKSWIGMMACVLMAGSLLALGGCTKDQAIADATANAKLQRDSSQHTADEAASQVKVLQDQLAATQASRAQLAAQLTTLQQTSEAWKAAKAMDDAAVKAGVQISSQIDVAQGVHDQAASQAAQWQGKLDASSKALADADKPPTNAPAFTSLAALIPGGLGGVVLGAAGIGWSLVKKGQALSLLQDKHDTMTAIATGLVKTVEFLKSPAVGTVVSDLIAKHGDVIGLIQGPEGQKFVDEVQASLDAPLHLTQTAAAA